MLGKTISNWTRLEISDGAGSFTPITNMQSLTPPSLEKNIAAMNHFGSLYPEKAPGSFTTGDVSITVTGDLSDDTHQYLLNSLDQHNQVETFRYVIDDGKGNAKYREFQGFVTSNSDATEYDSFVAFTFNIATTGTIGEWTDYPNP